MYYFDQYENIFQYIFQRVCKQHTIRCHDTSPQYHCGLANRDQFSPARVFPIWRSRSLSCRHRFRPWLRLLPPLECFLFCFSTQIKDCFKLSYLLPHTCIWVQNYTKQNFNKILDYSYCH